MAARRSKKMGPDWLRAVCMGLPSTTEDLKWGNDVVFSVGDKMYCGMGLAGEGFGFKCEPHVQAALIERPDIIFAPYAGKHGWV
ncbi:MAG: MmcQ/YjbR family DNA-binding protein, partial [Nannocystaceae bacterium]|nr:MmcQ/YjbR family DNA-binding protein [Nannocystaceae bacterium]